MPDRERLRLAAPDTPAGRALAQAWSGPRGVVGEVTHLPLEAAEAALRAGRADLALVPTLAVLRDPDAFSVVPGVALVGKAHGPVRLHLPDGLDAVTGEQTRIGVDPRFAQEAILAQVLLKEHYGAHPQFVPMKGDVPGAALDAVLLPPDAETPDGGLTLDLGEEWFELTTRPMVWALLAATGGVEPEEARFLRDAARELSDDDPDAPGLHTEEPAALTLAAYAHDGLDRWVHFLFYNRALEDLPDVPFIVIPEE